MNKKNTTDQNTERVQTEIVNTEYWISRTKSGKAVTIEIDGHVYITSFLSIEKFVSGEYKGVKLGELVEA